MRLYPKTRLKPPPPAVVSHSAKIRKSKKLVSPRKMISSLRNRLSPQKSPQKSSPKPPSAEPLKPAQQFKPPPARSSMSIPNTPVSDIQAARVEIMSHINTPLSNENNADNIDPLPQTTSVSSDHTEHTAETSNTVTTSDPLPQITEEEGGPFGIPRHCPLRWLVSLAC